MSHRPSWCCWACRYQLGEVVNGAVRIWVPAPLVGTDAASVECPRCHLVNVWRRTVEVK